MLDAPMDPKWEGWGGVFKDVYDKPSIENRIMRQLGIPLGTAVAIAIVLVILYPPFACKPTNGMEKPALSFPRICCWSVLAALTTIMLIHSNVFKSKSFGYSTR